MLEDISFTCGAQIQDLGRLNEVYTRKMNCMEPIERLYYSAKYSPVCIYCAADVNEVPKDKYPQCVGCKDKPIIATFVFILFSGFVVFFFYCVFF